MAIQIQGSAGSTIGEGGSSGKAVKSQSTPIEYSTFGHYMIGQSSGVIAAALAANSEVFQFRWSDSTRLCVINEITVSAAVSTTFFAAGVPMNLDLVKATSWTVAGSGGTRATPAALLKTRTSMGSTLVAASDIGIASTAALTAGTKTLETLSLNNVVASCPITASLYGAIIQPGTKLYEANMADGEHPLVLAQNEGFVIRSVAVPATGTWQLTVAVKWCEVSTY